MQSLLIECSRLTLVLMKRTEIPVYASLCVMSRAEIHASASSRLTVMGEMRDGSRNPRWTIVAVVEE